MLAAFEKLSKMLNLEKSYGYENKAVIHGFESFVDNWRQEVLDELATDAAPPAVDQIADRLRRYSQQPESERPNAIAEIEKLLQEAQASEAPEPRTPPLSKPGTVPPPAASQPAPESPAKRAPSQRAGAGLDAPVTTLPGISTANATKLERLNIYTVEDLLHHFPHRYDDYSKLKPINKLEYGEVTTIIGTIWETNTRRSRGGTPIVSSIVADASGTIEAVWFNQPFLTRQLRPGRRVVLSGKVDEYLGRLTMQSPAWEPLERDLIHTGRLVPIYPVTSGLTSRWMRRITKRVVDHWASRVPDPLPAEMRQRLGLMDRATALQQIHFPNEPQSAEAARHRLSFDEFLLIQLGMMRQRLNWRRQEGIPLPRNQALLESFVRSLPFELTTAQQKSIEHILDDLTQNSPMSRLLQGDVGSGKTVVATAAILMALASGKQAALMAPTEILAEQHYQTIRTLLANAHEWGLDRPVSVTLLTGGLRLAERRDAYKAIASGEADVVVGTHALIQRHVTFPDLGLVIVDEQHRFGVIQRAALRGKSGTAHMLVMSATPIPRSLALTLYGDLDLSVIDEMPAGRQPIETRWLLPRDRERAYAFLRNQIEKGRQAFILYPLVEESDKVEAKAAVEEFERLQEKIFPDLRLGLLHGRLKAREKERVMSQFHQGEIDILVSTSVVEVGIDVPNASVMLIEGADRFGLAQLHQFRGRVGRGPHPSYCLLVSDTVSPDDPDTKATWERLKAIEETQDGFVLAEKDLELRGPGDFFGVRQSGLPALRLASLSNTKVLELARQEAKAIFDADPMLTTPDYAPLAGYLARFWEGKGDLS